MKILYNEYIQNPTERYKCSTHTSVMVLETFERFPVRVSTSAIISTLSTNEKRFIIVRVHNDMHCTVFVSYANHVTIIKSIVPNCYASIARLVC